LSVPQIFVVETELMPVSETLGTPVEKFGSDDPAVPGEEMAIEIIEESLPRRGYTTQPGVSTPGTGPNPTAP
jgi:hypothetical protein